MKIKLALSLILGLQFSFAFAFKGDLTSISKRPNKNELFVAGEFKPLVVINSLTGEPIRSINVNSSVEKMEFSADGNTLLLASSRKVDFINPDNGQLIRSISGSRFFLFEQSKYIVDIDRWGSKSIKLLSTLDGSLVKEIKPDFTPNYAGISKDQKKVIYFSEAMDINNESKLIVKKTEPISGYNTFNKKYISEETDNKGCFYVVFNIETGKEELKKQIAYCPDAGSFGQSISTFEGNTYVLTYEMLLKIDAKGIATPIESPYAGFSYTATTSDDGRYILQSGGMDGFVYDCKDQKSIPFGSREFTTIPINGIDACSNKDTLYVLSSDFEIKTLNTNGSYARKFKLNKSLKEYRYALLYSNVYNKKEDRDKESAIMNSVFQENNQPAIDLETTAGKGEIIIAKTTTHDEAYKMHKSLKEKGLKVLVKITLIEE